MQAQSIEAEVFTYLVRERFVQQPGKFDKYTKILRDICSKSEDPSHGILELKKMFANHPDLLIGLNSFLPENDDKIPILNFHKKDNSPLKFTIEFVNKVHNRFSNNNNNGHVFIEFCDIMSMYRNKQVTINEVDRLLTDLFQNDPGLYVEFTRFVVDELEEDTEDSAGKFVFTSGNKGRKTRGEDLYQETLVIWETYKYELDMLHLPIQSTAEKLKSLEKDRIIIQEFQLQDFKCIELLYGRADEEDGEAMVQQLLSDPVGNVGARMENKCKEIEERKILMDRIWGEILEDIRERRREVRHSCFLEKVRREWVNCVY